MHLFFNTAGLLCDCLMSTTVNETDKFLVFLGLHFNRGDNEFLAVILIVNI